MSTVASVKVGHEPQEAWMAPSRLVLGHTKLNASFTKKWVLTQTTVLHAAPNWLIDFTGS